jgi:hypothetical protein
MKIFLYSPYFWVDMGEFRYGDHQIMSKSMYDVHVKPFMKAILYVGEYMKLRPFCYISFPVWMKVSRGDALHKYLLN